MSKQFFLLVLCLTAAVVGATETTFRPEGAAAFAKKQTKKDPLSCIQTKTSILDSSTSIVTRGGASIVRGDGKTSTVTGFPLFAPWVYPPIEVAFVILFLGVDVKGICWPSQDCLALSFCGTHDVGCHYRLRNGGQTLEYPSCSCQSHVVF